MGLQTYVKSIVTSPLRWHISRICSWGEKFWSDRFSLHSCIITTVLVLARLKLSLPTAFRGEIVRILPRDLEELGLEREVVSVTDTLSSSFKKHNEMALMNGWWW